MHDGPPSFEQKVAFLSRPDSWPVQTRGVDVVETRLACVFLTDRHAFKMKRPIRYHNVDFRTLRARREACEREVPLNRRLAGDVYRGAIALRRAADGSLGFGTPGTPVEWLVVMRRLPQDRMLDRLILRDAVRDEDVRRLAEVLTQFYRSLPPIECDPVRHVARLTRLTLEDQAALEGQIDGIPQSMIGSIARAQADFLREHPELVAQRVHEGRIVEGHGDLRPEHVCLLEHPVIIDALEFDGDLRALDAVSDLSFLALDCERLGAPELGARIMDLYCELAGDRPDPRLLRFYRNQHACARAKLAVWHVADPGSRGTEHWRHKARNYLHLAADGYDARGSSTSSTIDPPA